MHLSMLKLFAILMIGSIFGITSYNWKLNSLEQDFNNKDKTYIDDLFDLADSPVYYEDLSIHSLNNVSFRLNNFSITDKNQLKNCDSIIKNISFHSNNGDSLEQSLYLNQKNYLSFVTNHKTHLINQIGSIQEEQILELETSISELKNAIRLNPNNKEAIHNYSILQKLYENSDFYFQKSKVLSDLVYEQLNYDMKRDSLSQKEFSKKMFLKSTEEKRNSIKTEKSKETCKKEIQDSLSIWVNEELRNDYQKITIDSLKQYENIDLEFIEKLKNHVQSEKIISDFYKNKYPDLFKKTSIEHQKKILSDTTVNKYLQEILCKYMDCSGDKNSNSQDSNESKNSEDQQKSMEDYKNSKKTDEESQNKNSEEMKENLKDYDKKQQEKSPNSKKKDQSNSSKQKQQGKPNQSSSGSISQEKLEKHNITEEQALEALKQIQEESDNYLKNKKQGKQSQNYNDDKPDW